MEVYMEEISNIKFNLTPSMANKIVKINKLKINLFEIEEQISKKTGDQKQLVNQKEKLIAEIDIQKKKFIKEFQENNKAQINKYLNLKKLSD